MVLVLVCERMLERKTGMLYVMSTLFASVRACFWGNLARPIVMLFGAHRSDPFSMHKNIISYYIQAALRRMLYSIAIKLSCSLE